jgi:predicted transposase/invertase (TIGR01784 family)
MVVNGQRVDLEIQVDDEGDYPERSLYYWAREYSSALPVGGDYASLPKVVVISIVAFKMFDCEALHSEFRPMEVSRHTLLTEKQALHYFELPKLPADVGALSGGGLWLALFNAETEDELTRIEGMGVPELSQAISAYRAITATDEFRELERMRSLARSNEAAALRHARELERAKWEQVIADKDAELADKDAAIAKLTAQVEALMAKLDDANHG